MIGQLQRLADLHGKFTGEDQSHYIPELHAELLRALAYAHTAEPNGRKQSTAIDEPRFAAALESPAAIARREAALALADARFGPLPRTLKRRVYDPDRNVRQAALIVLAARHHPEALDLLKQAMLDQDLAVRETAVAGFGRLGGNEARDELRRTAKDGGDLLRAGAVAALGNLDDAEAMNKAADDKSWRVRRVVAQWLAREPAGALRELAQRLVLDANLDVARAAITSVGAWPLAEAGPILMGAMEGRLYLPRKAAAKQLAKRWPPAADFEPEAPQPKRDATMATLRNQWDQRSAGAATGRNPPKGKPPHRSVDWSSAAQPNEIAPRSPAVARSTDRQPKHRG